MHHLKNTIIIAIAVIVLTTTMACTRQYSSWHLNSMNINMLWSYSKGESQTIAFIDTGINLKYAQEFGNRIVLRNSVLDDGNESDTEDIHGHGTEMVSIACGDSKENIYGIATQSKILIIKGVNDEGKTNNKCLLKALECAEQNNATVVCISLGGHKTSEQVISKIKKMTDKGIAIVAAAGDYRQKDLLFPANQDDVISVEALTEQNKLWERSNSSNSSKLRFPGKDILAISSYDGLIKKESISGTSEACAVATGYIALLKDYYLSNVMSLSNEELLDLLATLDSKSGVYIDYLKPFKALS